MPAIVSDGFEADAAILCAYLGDGSECDKELTTPLFARGRDSRHGCGIDRGSSVCGCVKVKLCEMCNLVMVELCEKCGMCEQEGSGRFFT